MKSRIFSRVAEGFAEVVLGCFEVELGGFARTEDSLVCSSLGFFVRVLDWVICI